MKKQINFPGTQVPKMAQKPILAPGILPGVKPTDLKVVTCKKCNEPQERFIAISRLRHASPFQTQQGQPMIINFNNGFACLKCGAVNEFTIDGVIEPKNEVPDKDENLN
ncbi:MAG: hypothetical protein KAS32_01305 [Candidatus Peribacteraceae bacterium]|nr:hypothetical protein [Candidatus Peribacteraceae bacterium]